VRRGVAAWLGGGCARRSVQGIMFAAFGVSLAPCEFAAFRCSTMSAVVVVGDARVVILHAVFLVKLTGKNPEKICGYISSNKP